MLPAKKKKIKFERDDTAVTLRYGKQLKEVWHGDRGSDDITYSHMAMCQVYLPYNRCPSDLYQVREGKLTMRIQAAKYLDEQTGEEVSREVPYGTRARLLLYLMNELAIETQSRSFCISKNFSDLTRKLGLGRTGREIQDLKTQLESLCTAFFTFQWDLTSATDMHHFNLVKSIATPRVLKGMGTYANVERNRRGFHVTLSTEYFESLVDKAVPLDKRAILGLQNSPMCLDIYTWLTQRLHRIEEGKPSFVAWSNLHQQFGRAYGRMCHFKQRFRENLTSVRFFYKGARITEIPNKGFQLFHSPPPIPPKTQLLFPR